MGTKQAAKIAKLNDMFRRNEFMPTLTVGVRAFSDVSWLIYTVQRYDKFTEDNDPYGEHDFGSLGWRGHKVFWKIDYYDEALRYGEDPLSQKCRRVLTIMLAEEY